MTEVEGLGDLINADTEEQRKQALRQMGGAQRRQYDEWRAALLKSLAPTPRRSSTLARTPTTSRPTRWRRR